MVVVFRGNDFSDLVNNSRKFNPQFQNTKKKIKNKIEKLKIICVLFIYMYIV